MISKPPAGWHREEGVAIKTMRGAASVAQGSVKAARTGSHAARGLICWAFAILWGFAALMGGLFGSLPTFLGVGLLAALMAWCGKGAFAKARDAANPGHRGKEQNMTRDNQLADMSGRRIDYGQSQLLRSFFLYAGVGIAGIYLLPRMHGFIFFVALIAVPCFLVLAVGTLLKMMGDRLALQWDARGLTVATLWRRRTYFWSNIVDIKVSVVSTYAFGVIRTARVETLGIQVRGGLTGNTQLSILPKLLDFGGRTLAGLVTELHAAKAGESASVGRPAQPVQSLTPRMPSANAPDSAADFDPDAIMARYLAEKAQQSAGVQQYSDAAAPANTAAMPRRPQFGRKVAH